MAYSVENALLEWAEGERRMNELDEPARLTHEHASTAVLAELRRRLGSAFTIEELAAAYGDGVDWATDLSWTSGARVDSAAAVDAAFARYAREASNFGGGRRREPFDVT